MKIVDEISKTYCLSEIGHGQVEVKFALINEDTGETITPFCKCKDYFNDLFWSNKTKNKVDVCGFKWQPNQDEGVLERDTVCIALRLSNRSSDSPNDLTQSQLDNIIRLINKISLANNFLEASGILSEDNKYIVIRVDRKWFDVPYVSSTLFLLLRAGFNYKEGPVKECFKDTSLLMSPHDAMYLKQGEKLVGDLENGIIDDSQKYEHYNSDSNAHCSSGLVAYSNQIKSRKK